MAEEYHEGPLKGCISANVLINAEATAWLKHAVKETGYSIERLIEISAEEAALRHAKANKLISVE
jgi:hypothetical protein